VTVFLAWKTRALAQSAQKTAEVAERELELIRGQTEAATRQSVTAEAALNASVRPLLVDVPLHTMRTIYGQERPGGKHPAGVDVSVISASIDEGTRTARLTVPVRNIGAGPAIGLGVAVTREDDDATIARGKAPSVVAAGDSDWYWFEDTAGTASAAAVTPLVHLLQSNEDLVVEVAYADIANRQEAATSLYLTRSGRTDRSYRVTKVAPGHEPRLTSYARDS
jgi:hypothetical protein